MSVKIKNRFIFCSICIIVGGTISAIVWSFLKIMSLGIKLLWDVVPANIPVNNILYTFAICVIGAIIIGLLQKKFGEYPEELDVVMTKIKRDGRYPYNNIPIVLVMAILPLLFGASIGPEAGLTGVIVGLCYWAGDKMKFSGQKLKDLTQVGISASLSAIFFAPFFGFIMPIENNNESDNENDDNDNSFVFPKKYKTFSLFLAIGSSVGVFALLNSIFGGGMGLPHFDNFTFVKSDLIYIVPLVIFGSLLGMFYYIFEKLTKNLSKALKGKPIVIALIGGVSLATCGVFLPLTMFSGEEETHTLIENFSSYAPFILIATAFIKVFITNLCIHTGWRGGHFFPAIFAGVSLGYGISLLLPISPVFAVCIVTASTLGIIMKKPLSVSLLLMLCFPFNSIVFLLIASFLASIIPIPKIFNANK